MTNKADLVLEKYPHLFPTYPNYAGYGFFKIRTMSSIEIASIILSVSFNEDKGEYDIRYSSLINKMPQIRRINE